MAVLLIRLQQASDIKVEGTYRGGKRSFRIKPLTAYDEYGELVGADGAAILDELIAEIEAYEAE